jgi:hypothetical protein
VAQLTKAVGTITADRGTARSGHFHLPLYWTTFLSKLWDIDPALSVTRWFPCGVWAICVMPSTLSNNASRSHNRDFTYFCVQWSVHSHDGLDRPETCSRNVIEDAPITQRLCHCSSIPQRLPTEIRARFGCHIVLICRMGLSNIFYYHRVGDEWRVER